MVAQAVKAPGIERKSRPTMSKPEPSRASQKAVRNALGPKGPEVMERLRDELESCLPDHEDRDSILPGLVCAVITEELTRNTITKQPMIPGLASDVDKTAVISHWKCLAEHYRGSKSDQHLREGVEQLERLNPDVASRVIHDIRRRLAPGINWSMERTVIQPGLKFPGGRFVLDAFRVRGPRVDLLRLRSRLLRLGARSILWVAATSGSAHWILWVIFEQPYLIQQFPGLGKAVQFTLIGCTTLLAWVFTKSRIARFRAGESRLIGPLVGLVGSGLVFAAWLHWILWVVFGVPDLLQEVAPFAKMGQVVLLLGGLAAAYAFFRHSDDHDTEGGGSGRSNGSSRSIGE